MDNPIQPQGEQPTPENQNTNPSEAPVPAPTTNPVPETPETSSAEVAPENSTPESPAATPETSSTATLPETPPAGNPETPGTSKRTKFLLALIGITMVGAIAYFLSASVIFKGAFITPGSPEELALKEALDNASKSEKADYETKYIAKHKDEINGIDRTLEMTATGQIAFKDDGNGLAHNFTFVGIGSSKEITQAPQAPPPPPSPATTTPPGTPPPEILLNILKISYKSVNLEWETPVNLDGPVDIYRGTNKDDLSKIEMKDTESIQYKYLPAEKTLYYQVILRKDSTKKSQIKEVVFPVAELATGNPVMNEGERPVITWKWKKPFDESFVDKYYMFVDTKPIDLENLNPTLFQYEIGNPESKKWTDEQFQELIENSPAAEYYYALIPFNKDGEPISISENQVTIKENNSVPKNLKISYAVGEKKLKLTWKKVSGPAGYILYRKEGAETKQPTKGELQIFWTKIETELDNTTDAPYYKDEPVTGWQNIYSYVVTAKKENEESDPSDIAVSDPDKVWKAVLLEIESISAKEIKLKWTSTLPLGEGTKFHIIRSVNEPTFLDQEVAALGKAINTYLDKNFPPEKEFYYKIWRMKDGDKCPDACPEVSNSEKVVLPPGVLTAKNLDSIVSKLPTIELIVIRTGDRMVNLKWNGGNIDTEAEKYAIYRIPKDEIELNQEYFYADAPLNGTHNLDVPVTDYGDYTFAVVTKGKKIYEFLEISNGVTMGITEPPVLTVDKEKVKNADEKPKFTWTENGNPSADNGKYWLYREKGKEIKILENGNDIEEFTSAVKIGPADPSKSEKEIIDETLILDGSKYYYRLLRTNKNGQHIGVSNQITVETEKITEAIALAAKIKEKNKVTLEWSGGTVNDTKSYKIFRSTENNDPTKNDLNPGAVDDPNIKIYEDTVSNPGIYYYRIGASDENEIFEWSNSVSIEIPGEFELFTLNDKGETVKEIQGFENNELKLQWNSLNHSMLDKYWIYQLNQKPGITDPVAFNFSNFLGYNKEALNATYNVDKTVSTYQDTSLSILDGKRYYYVVVARDTNQQQIMVSDVVSVEMKKEKLPQRELWINTLNIYKDYVLPVGYTNAFLKWANYTAPATWIYAIYRSETSPVETAPDKVKPIGTVNPNSDPAFKGNLYFKDENLAPGKKYYYKFLLKKEDGTTIQSESNEVVVYTQQKPVTASVNPSEDGLSAVITWPATSEDSADYYKVYRNQGPFPKYSNNDGQLKFSELEKMTPLSGEISPDDMNEYIDETLPANENKFYYYTVISFKDGKIVAASYPKQILSPNPPISFNEKTSFWKPFASLLAADVTGGNIDSRTPIIKETISGSGSLTYSAPKADGQAEESTSGIAGTITITDEYKVYDGEAGTTQLGNTVTATLTLTVKDNKIENSTVAIAGQNENLDFVTEQYVKEIFKTHLKVDTFVENHEKEILKNLKNGMKNNITKSEFIGTNMEILDGGKYKTQTRKMLDSNQYLASYLSGNKTDELNITVDATKKLPAFEGKLGFTEGNEFSYKVYNFGPKTAAQPSTDEKIPLTVTATTDGKVTLTWEDPTYVADTTEYQVYRTDSTFEIKKGDDASAAFLTGRELTKIKGKTHQDQVQTQSTVKKYYYAVALLDGAKKVIKTSEVKEISIGQEQQGCTGDCALGGIAPGGNTNFQVGGGGGGGGGPSLQTLLAMQAAKEKAEKEKAEKAAKEKAAKEQAAKEKLKSAAPKNPYADVTPQTEGYEAIMRLTQQGVVEGYEEKGKKLFKPSKPVIRAEAAKLILKSVCVEPGDNAKNKKQVFSDVKAGKDIWFFPHTKETYLRGFFTGYKGNEDSQGRPQFKPENKITRAELTKVLIEVLRRQNFIKVPPVGKTEPWWDPFLKIGKTIDLYWQDKTKMPAIKQIITDEEAKKPTQSLTRAQTAIMIDRSLSLIGGCGAGAKPAAKMTAKPADKIATKK